MKQEFSKSWISSKQTRKQRKYRANAPLHVKQNLLGSHLSKDLRKKYGKRNVPLRKDDDVRIKKGEFKGKSGKIETINKTKLKVSIVNITRTKKDGSKVVVWFDPSNLQIKELNLEDSKRKQALGRSSLIIGSKDRKEERNEELKTEIKDKEKNKNASN